MMLNQAPTYMSLFSKLSNMVISVRQKTPRLRQTLNGILAISLSFSWLGIIGRYGLIGCLLVT